ncbi:MAG: chalcone isomerase family protein [Syntrophobacterales bacterium]|nr:chalcone isomerase family protein [Syntrophobacterales bacterium]
MKKLLDARFYMSIILTVLTLFSIVEARELKGVNFPDSLQVGKENCVLNGIGVRKKFMIEAYYAGLYLKKPTKNAQEVISNDEPKAVLIQVVHKEIPADKWQEGWKEGFAITAPNAQSELKKSIDQFIAFFNEPLKKGEQVLIKYDPTKGTEVVIKGKSKGILPGKDFMKALWGIWFGEKPASSELKAGMLGESK